MFLWSFKEGRFSGAQTEFSDLEIAGSLVFRVGEIEFRLLCASDRLRCS
jgi:hypothetical protein